MANYCDYEMVIIGYPNNVGEFLNIIRNPYNYGDIYFFKNPTPHLSLLDRFIVLAERENLEIVIILTKVDLDDENTTEKIKEIYELSGYKVIPVSSKSKMNIDKVKEELNNRIEQTSSKLFNLFKTSWNTVIIG